MLEWPVILSSVFTSGRDNSVSFFYNNYYKWLVDDTIISSGVIINERGGETSDIRCIYSSSVIC